MQLAYLLDTHMPNHVSFNLVMHHTDSELIHTHILYHTISGRVIAVNNNNNNNPMTALQPFVRDYPGELVPEETLSHPPS